jgi:hypothetical protein
MTPFAAAILFLAVQADDAVPPANGRPKGIEQAVQSMKAAKDKLAEGQTGPATQDLQKQALAALDELLKAPPQPPSPNQSGQGGGGQSQDSQQTSSQDKNQSKSNAHGKPSEANGEQQAGEQRNRSQADDSEERTGSRRTGVAAPLPRRRLEVDVWGHLPEKVREQLLNGYGERMVPQYEALVRKFYESLADTAAEPTSSSDR